MQNKQLRRVSDVILTAMIASLLGVTAVQAQGPGDGPPPGGPPPGGFGGGPPRHGGRPGMGGPGRMSLAVIPAAALASSLKLTDEQQTKIAEIQATFTATRKSLMPPPPSDENPSERPSRETMRATMEKMRAAETQAEADIKAVLTDDQNTAVPALLRQMGDLRAAGIPIELLGTLNLTPSQKARILALVRSQRATQQSAMESARQSGDFAGLRETMQSLQKATQDKVKAVLTAAQKQTLTEWEAAHPSPAGRGFGGPGGPPPDGQGGPPPLDGPGGPPPPDDRGGPPPDGQGGPPPPGDGM